MIMDKNEREKQVLDLLMSRKDIRKLVEKSNECYSKMDFVGEMGNFPVWRRKQLLLHSLDHLPSVLLRQ